MKRMIRPVWGDKDYIIGNEKNGFIGNKKLSEEWENEMPCDFCYKKEDCRGVYHCKPYGAWLLENPLRFSKEALKKIHANDENDKNKMVV